MPRQYGLKLKPKDPTGYILGGGMVPFESLQPNGDWSDYLPIKEVQNLNNIEPYACVTFTILNCIEILIKRKYGLDRNYSDRFLAYVSGTKDLQGNDPHLVAEFLRKIGVVFESSWPFDYSVNTFDKFYAQPTPKLYDLAKEFNEEWDFKHEYVNSDAESITKALQSSPLLVSVPAWFKNGQNLYFRPTNVPDNHATTLINERSGEFRRVFDSYDAPYIKDLSWDVLPSVIKRFYISKKKLSTSSWWSRFVAWYKMQVSIWNFLTPKE